MLYFTSGSWFSTVAMFTQQTNLISFWKQIWKIKRHICTVMRLSNMEAWPVISPKESLEQTVYFSATPQSLLCIYFSLDLTLSLKCVEVWFESHFKLTPNVVWIWFAKIAFHVFLLLSRLPKIYLDTIWRSQKFLKKTWVGSLEHSLCVPVSQYPGTVSLKWNAVVVNVIDYTCSSPAKTGQVVCCGERTIVHVGSLSHCCIEQSHH